ncbi:MAG TPA: hypothetical protein ENK91_02160 [Bacteroidetes bacterium]|nr:hypothetical protein [Bacteroidota bacterium]
MKKIFFITILISTVFAVNAQKLKPYIIAGYSSQDINTVKKDIKQKLKDNGFEVLGSYNPMSSGTRVVFGVSDNNLRNAVKKTGGFRGFALALRVALTNEGGKIMISYTNPEYWGRAYFGKQWNLVNNYYANIDKKFKSALSGYGGKTFIQFGSKDGIDKSDLKKYHYMFGMPYFDDNVKLKEFSDYGTAIATIEKNLNSGMLNVKKVYSIFLNGKKIALYGIGLTGKDGEKLFMPKIDLNSPKHTAFLPYELLVVDNKAYMLHGRFRIALSFPDLSMGQFMKIVSTPGYIEDTFKAVCK